MTVKNNTVAIVNSKAPYADNSGKDALDLALIFGSYEQDISLFFHGEGVWQLLADQHPEKLNQKNYLKTFGAFELYDIEKIYVCLDSINERMLDDNFHIDNIVILDKTSFNQRLAEHNVIFRF